MILALLIGWNIRVPVFKMAILRNFVDKPNKRSSHTGCVPEYRRYCCIFGIFMFFLLFARFNTTSEFQYILLGAILIFLIGIYDDLLEISAPEKSEGRDVRGIGFDCRRRFLFGEFAWIFRTWRD